MSLNLTTPVSTTFLDLTHASLPTLARDHTILVWVRPQTFSSPVSSIWDLGDGSPEERWGLRTRGTDEYEMSGWSESQSPAGGPGLGGVNATPTTVDTWTSIVLGMDTYTARWVSINGETNTNNQSFASFIPTVVSPSTLRLGVDLVDGRLWDGYIAELCIWNRILTDAEQQSLYISPEVGRLPTEVATGNVVLYVPLTNSITATVGQNLVENGAIAWDAAVHPTIQSAATDLFVDTSGRLIIDSNGDLRLI